MPKIQVVTDKAREARVFDSYADMEAAGYERDGTRCGGAYLHPVLRGQPCYKGLAGPMYGRIEGVDAVRYEDWGTCDLLSR